MSDENMSLWNQVERTDSNFTKKGNKGGYKFTSVNPQYTIKKATALWGSCGEGWEIHSEGHPVEAAEGNKVWIEKVTIKYPGPASGEMCEVSQYGVSMFAYMTKGENGYLKVDEEAPKKALTNGISKTLSLLGFSADLWLEYYDDPSYVASVQRDIEAEKRATQSENRLLRFKNTLEQTGAEGVEDEEYLCRFWSKGEYGAADVGENEDALTAVLQGQSAVTSGKDREKVPVAKQLEAARKYIAENKQKGASDGN